MAPLKRHPGLQAFSRDHHHGLLLCWKIRKGLSCGIAAGRIASYVRWFWKTYLKAHFDEEESRLFSLLNPGNELVIRAMAEHEQLRELIAERPCTGETLGRIAEMIELHIRFEERMLFPHIQETFGEEKLAALHLPGSIFVENNDDPFWLSKS